METSIYNGLFAIAGAAVGGACTVAASLIERRWGRAKRDIHTLTEQVEAYYQLERLYKQEVAELTGKSAKTVMEQMRTQVAESELFVRPTMTSDQAKRIRDKWRGS